MSERRWHPFRNEWIITATHRQDRTFLPPDDYCPLCPTTNAELPTEIPRPDYDIVVFENKFPSLQSPPPRTELDATSIVPVLPSAGVCEVICYTAEHDKTLADLPVSQVTKLISIWRDRYTELATRDDVAYVFIFENKGVEIGVTLSHPHGQIYGYPFVPNVVRTRLFAEREYFESKGSTLQQDWLAEELLDGRRIVCEWDHWVAVVPAFARYPYEVHIVPRMATCTIRHFSADQRHGLAAALSDVAKRLDRLFGFSMPYIMAVHNSEEAYSSFSVEFTPPYRTADKLKYSAGSEAACGVFINDALPEISAKAFRETS